MTDAANSLARGSVRTLRQAHPVQSSLQTNLSGLPVEILETNTNEDKPLERLKH